VSIAPGRVDAIHAVDAAYERIAADGRDGIWIELVDRDVAAARARAVESRVARGARLPLAGVTVAVKGNVDVEGIRTTAGCPTYGAVAPRSAAVVRSLESAGAVVVGVTNLDQFATGLVGTRSPYGVCPNAHWPELIAGGSSAGSAVSVAAGLVDLAVGTDTAGSGRVPAAANGIVGLKPTRGRLSTAGIVPACRSIDCVSMLARSVDLAALAADLAATGVDPEDPWSRSAPLREVPGGRVCRLGVPTLDVGDFDDDSSGPARFEASVGTAVGALRASRVDVGLDDFLAAGRLLYEGAFVAERYEAVGQFVVAHRHQVDPIVGSIIAAAADLPAWRVFADRTEVARLAARTAPVWDDVDVMVVPTVPRIPTIDEVLAEPLAVNSMLGRYTNFVNLLDLCAVTIPTEAPTPDRPPASITLVAPAWADDLVVALAREITASIEPVRNAMRGRPASLRTR
jgi:allophanate hydrolase